MNLSKKLGKEIRVASLSLNGNVVAEFFDEKLDKWVYVDVDPLSKIFIPRIDKKPLSIDELLSKPELILKDDFLLKKKYENSIDSIFTFNDYKKTVEKLSKGQDYKRTEFINGSLSFDYYIKLAPNQGLEWSYTVDALYLNANKCNKEFLTAYAKFQSGDSATIVNALIQYSKCYGQDPKYIVPRIGGESPLFGDSTFFGKDNLRVNSFKTSLPKGVYESNQVYIPHLIKKVSGDLIVLDKTLKKGYEINLFDFSMEEQENEKYNFKESLIPLDAGFSVLTENAEIEFYSNDRLNFEVNKPFQIAVIEGGIVVEQFKNGKSIGLVSGKKP